MPQITTLDATPVSRFAFGAMQFGSGADEAASKDMFATCRSAGINHFDTAYGYGDGASETMLSGMIAADRDSLLIATKFGGDGDASKANLAAQFDVSRRRLKLDVIDLLYMHRFDPHTDLHETMEALAVLKQAGQIRYVGLSNFAAWQVMKAVAVAARFDLTIDIIQPMYSLLKRQAEVELLPMAADQAIAVASYSPLGAGLLTGKYQRGETGRLAQNTVYKSRYREGWMLETAAGLTDLAAEIGTDPATLAVAWVAAHPAAPMPIISGRTSQQLRPSLAALQFDMTPEIHARISALSPEPPPATDRSET